MVELTFQGILSTPCEPKGITDGKSVYHVPERVFRMSPVYTKRVAPGSIPEKGQAALKGRNTAEVFRPFRPWCRFRIVNQGRRAPLRFALAPGFHTSRLWRSDP